MSGTQDHFTISGSTRCLGLLGSGIAHTLSPQIHNFSAERLNLDCIYLAWDSLSQRLPGPDFFAAMWDFGTLGFNVTLPFKEVAAALFPESGLRSVNTLHRGPQGWQACSTDAEGFLLGLSQIKLSLQDFAAVVILGNGGAALALYEYFLRRATLPIVVLRRNRDRDKDWSKAPDRVRFADLSQECLADSLREYPKALLIQTTSAPLHGERLDYLLPALRQLQGAMVDLVYGKTSVLLDHARNLGIPTQDGLPMLIGQALLGQKLWWGRSAEFGEVDSMLRSYLLNRSAGTG